MKFHVIFTNINIHFIPQPILWGWVDGTPIWNLCILPCVAKPIVHSILSYVSIFLSTHHMHHIHNIHLKSASGDAKGRLVCEGWPPSSSLPFFHIPTHHKWRTAPLTSCLLARQSGSIIYTPLNCTVSYNSYVPYRLLWNTVQEHFTQR